MLNFIVQYWLGWAFGIICLGITIWIKRWAKLEKEKMERTQKDKASELRAEVKDEIVADVNNKVDEIKQENVDQSDKIHQLEDQQQILKSGILSLQGKQYKDFCRTLLMSEHEITIDEYEQEEYEYSIYKGLGGNHKGDTLHLSVVTKYEAQLSKRIEKPILNPNLIQQ